MTSPAKYTATAATRPRIDGVKTKTAARHAGRARLADGDPARRRHGAVHEVRPGLRLGDVSGRGQGLALPRKQVDNFACVAGMVKLVLIDTREDSPTNGAVNEFFIGTQNPPARAGPEPRVPRLEVHQPRAVAGRERPHRAVSTTPSRTSTGSHPHGTLAYDWTRKDG